MNISYYPWCVECMQSADENGMPMSSVSQFQSQAQCQKLLIDEFLFQLWGKYFKLRILQNGLTFGICHMWTHLNSENTPLFWWLLSCNTDLVLFGVLLWTKVVIYKKNKAVHELVYSWLSGKHLSVVHGLICNH